MTPVDEDVEQLVERVTLWAAGRADVVALALVGSHARGAARPDSDVDLMLVTERPRDYLSEQGWLERFGRVARISVEEWGAVTSLRVHYASGLEVELGITSPAWASGRSTSSRKGSSRSASSAAGRPRVSQAQDAERLCPRARCEEGAVLLGIVGPDGRIAYLNPRVEIDGAFVVIHRVLEDAPPPTAEDLPRCSIRSDCRWFAQAGATRATRARWLSRPSPSCSRPPATGARRAASPIGCARRCGRSDARRRGPVGRR